MHLEGHARVHERHVTGRAKSRRARADFFPTLIAAPNDTKDLREKMPATGAIGEFL
jgi:hypothetical protein